MHILLFKMLIDLIAVDPASYVYPLCIAHFFRFYGSFVLLSRRFWHKVSQAGSNPQGIGKVTEMGLKPNTCLGLVELEEYTEGDKGLRGLRELRQLQDVRLDLTGVTS
ncbi:hypothetical protein TREMEDRAFT_65713 [Tremella mesenterica DSM 1558]|uniref:uncharacterized protein n=1 Tax=Tremella mesenterica (strain ATCC 24925 / CBS 8224 / DSM 1558 / NBRC 9311 / NRRL Y-6157 / RJB 2259-6 / UBC 559-6) TaxID=578456 RepID=UPI00032C472F|nr:uncharacterized protein TREMEDRAFT_65713 [Tremella mesenterica DSM 1558]EIW66421.1 hypothetical protein TREMEDRAFT_65713 [Tremella mesenterica DSM 1558]